VGRTARLVGLVELGDDEAVGTRIAVTARSPRLRGRVPTLNDQKKHRRRDPWPSPALGQTLHSGFVSGAYPRRVDERDVGPALSKSLIRMSCRSRATSRGRR